MAMEPMKNFDPKQLGDWRIMGRLGEGGFGTVFLAERGAQKAAVKVLKTEISDDNQARANLAKEADVLRTLSDPAIGKIIDSDLEGEIAWIATEFINGPTLDSKVRFEGPLDEHAWFNLAATLFHALVTAHEMGIIHKDVKPSNIILGETGTKLIDFGIAHISGELTKTMTIHGREGSTPFSAPEHFTTKSYTAMDVFSAAATLAYAGRGSGIWSGESELQLMKSIYEDEPNLVGLSQHQTEFLLPLLNKNASDRPTAREALEITLKYLEQYSSDAPVNGIEAWIKRRKPAKAPKSKMKIAFLSSLALSFTAVAAYALTAQQSPAPTETGSQTQVVVRESPSSVPSANPKVEAKSTSADCENAFVNGKDEVATKCLEPANSGDVRSMYYIGQNASSNGKKNEAEKWFLKAAAKDDVSSMGQLAQIYLDRKDTANYKTWVTKCANYLVKSDSGARCKLLLGIDLLNSNQINKGVNYLKDSVDYGNGSAATLLGVYYAGIQENNAALSWYEKAAELNDSEGLKRLIILSNKLGKNDIYMKWLKISADDGNGENAWLLSMEYFSKEDYKTSKKYAQLGANAGNTNAMGILGIIMYKVDNDISGAKVWLKRAAIAKDSKAINILGLIARVEEKNYQDSVNWYKKSAALGDLEGGYWLGAVYAGGLNDGASACTAFKDVISNADELKRLGTFDKAAMETWVIQAQAGIKETC